MTLIAEDLLLLLLDDDSGRLNGTAYPQPALGGALLVELALLGAVGVEERRSAWSSAKVVAKGRAPEDPVLRAAHAVVREKPRTARDLVERLGKGARDTLADRLVERGILERVDGKVLGLFPTTRWPSADAAHEAEVRRALTAVLVEKARPDERTGALIALLVAIDKAHRTVQRGEVSSREIRKRAKAVAEGDWAAKAVRDAIAASTTAITAGVGATAAATS